MSSKKINPSQDITNSVLQEVLLDETPGPSKPSNKKNKKEKVTTSSPQSGSDSQGSSKKIIPTPPDADAFVRHDEKGRIVFDTRAISEQNKMLVMDKKILTDEVVSLRARVEELSLKSSGSQPVPTPSKDLLTTEGLERAHSNSSNNSMDALFRFVADKMCSAVSTGEVVLPIPSLPYETSGPSKKVSPQDVESNRSSVRSCARDILGSSMGEASGDELDITMEDNEG